MLAVRLRLVFWMHRGSRYHLKVGPVLVGRSDHKTELVTTSTMFHCQASMLDRRSLACML